ncbi:AAA family ATPase [Paenibacillus sp. GCM10027627]|uniref:AAA family ATPase n=1 Tax=unclassified Paenibacillus TaxID=185978 RepID=UPI00363E6B9F
MKLMEAHIDGFGSISNRRLDLDAPVIVVFGPNEAGKSTLFGFLRTMLYGFARRASSADRQEPLYGGRHGGSLILKGADGACFVLLRHADEAGGKPRIRRVSEGSAEFGAEMPLEQSNWELRFLGGMNERLFRTLFAITLTDLQEASALSGAELGNHLYQAGWDGGRSIAKAEKEISQGLEAMFKPRGTNQTINLQMKELDSLEAELRKLGDDIDGYNELKRKEEMAEQALAQVNERLPETRRLAALLRKAILLRSAWLRRAVLLAERESIGYAERLPAGAESIWADAIRLRGEMSERIDVLLAERHLLQRQRNDVNGDSGLIALEAETESLLLASERMRALQDQRLEWESELRELDESIASLITGISPEWTERQLRELAVTIADRDYARRMKEEASAGRSAADRRQAELEAIRAQAKELKQRLEEAETASRESQARFESSRRGRMGFFIPESKASLSTAWDLLDEALRRLELGRAERAAQGVAEGAASDRAASWAIWAGIGFAGAAAALGTAAIGGWAGDAASISTAGAISFGGAAVVFLAAGIWRRAAADKGADRATRGRGNGRRKMGGASSEQFGVREALEGLLRADESKLSEWLESLRRDGNSASALRAVLRTEVQERLEAMASYEGCEARRLECESRYFRIRKELEERREMEGAEALKRGLAAADWEHWLAVRALPAGMSPESALESFEIAEAALEKLKQYDRISFRLEEAKREWTGYREKTAELCGTYEQAVRLLNDDPALALRWLQAEIRRHAALLEEAKSMDARLNVLTLELESMQLRMTEWNQKIKGMMDEAQVTDEGHYWEAIKHRRLLTALDQERNALDIELAAGTGEEGGWLQVEASLQRFDGEQLQEQYDKRLDEETGLMEEQRVLLERRGELRGALERLQQEEARRERLMKRELTLAGLDASMERYAVLAIGKALIDKTKRIYEEERQPAVLRNASRYIRHLTQGKYIRVHASSNRQGIEVENRDGQWVDSGKLSRGTAEQLYLAMRLALAKEYKPGANMPLLLDDPFVNFDADRLKAAIKWVAELADERQIVLFTCHEHTRDMLLAARGDAKLVDLSSAAAL